MNQIFSYIVSFLLFARIASTADHVLSCTPGSPPPYEFVNDSPFFETIWDYPTCAATYNYNDVVVGSYFANCTGTNQLQLLQRKGTGSTSTLTNVALQTTAGSQTISLADYSTSTYPQTLAMALVCTVAGTTIANEVAFTVTSTSAAPTTYAESTTTSTIMSSTSTIGTQSSSTGTPTASSTPASRAVAKYDYYGDHMLALPGVALGVFVLAMAL